MSSNKDSEGSLEEEVDDMDMEEKTSTYNEMESKSTSTKGSHATIIRQWNLFAQEQEYPLWVALTEKDVCGTVAYTLLAIPAGDGRELAQNYASELFSSTSVAHLLQGKLKSYRDVMTAGLLMYYEQTKTDLGHDSLLIRVMHTCAKRVDVSFSTLRQWGTLIKDHFFVSNAANYASAPNQDATEKVVAIMQEMVLKKNDKIDKLVSEVTEMKGVMKNVESMLEQLCLTGASATPPRPRKAAKTSGDDTAASLASASKAPPTAPSTNQPPTDVFAAMTSAQARHVVTDFTGAKDWSLTKLVQEVLKGKTNLDVVNWHNGKLGKSMASKVKKAYNMLEGLANDDEKKYFDCRLLPLDKDAGRFEWLEEVSQTVGRLEILMIDDLVRRKLPDASELEITNAKSKQKTNVSTLGGMIEKLNTAENKAAGK